MAKSIITAFNEFLRDKVNLDTEQTKTAKASKDWLIGQISNIAGANLDFPKIESLFTLHYGSFARRTKTKPLDDIDIMIGLDGNNCTYSLYSTTHATIQVNNTTSNLTVLCNAGTNTLNSIKVINRFILHLKEVHQYRNAELKRNNVAAVLNLTSYDWVFDIVPCFRTVDDALGRNFYFIPDGDGNWQMTDPRIDQNRVTAINQKHNGKVLNVVRIIKFWNKQKTIITIPSYLLENIILNYYDTNYFISDYVDIEVPKILEHLTVVINLPFYDPKGMQGDINTLTIEERAKVSNIASEHAKKANTARTYETAGNQHMSTLYWYDVFGDDFPRWG